MKDLLADAAQRMIPILEKLEQLRKDNCTRGTATPGRSNYYSRGLPCTSRVPTRLSLATPLATPRAACLEGSALLTCSHGLFVVLRIPHLEGGSLRIPSPCPCGGLALSGGLVCGWSGQVFFLLPVACVDQSHGCFEKAAFEMQFSGAALPLCGYEWDVMGLLCGEGSVWHRHRLYEVRPLRVLSFLVKDGPQRQRFEANKWGGGAWALGVPGGYCVVWAVPCRLGGLWLPPHAPRV